MNDRSEIIPYTRAMAIAGLVFMVRSVMIPTVSYSVDLSWK